MTCMGRNEGLNCAMACDTDIGLTIAGHTIILIAYVLTTTFRWRWRWFVLVAGRWARRVRWVWWWLLIMLIICTRWDFIYTFAATRTVLAVFVLLLVFRWRRRWCSRGTATTGRDNIRRRTRSTRIGNWCVGARRGALRGAAATRLFLLAAGRRRRRCHEGCWCERIHWAIRRARRLMRHVGVLLGRRWRVRRVGFVRNGFVRWNRLHISSLFLQETRVLIKKSRIKNLHSNSSPIYCSDADNSRNTWRYPSNCRPLRTAVPVVVRTSRETAACIRICCTAYKRQLLLSILCYYPHRCSRLKRRHEK